jgi:predicted O-methyltransferase YrrM
MNRVIEQIYRSGCVEDAQGNTYRHNAFSVTLEAGALLYDCVRAWKPEKTIEIGMGYGLSTLCICQAHHDNGSGSHTAIDPLEDTLFKSIGLLNLERAELKQALRFYQARSDEVLPQLCAQKERFGFALIDGSHLFDYVLVDFFYIDKLLNVGGHVAFEDLWMPGVRKVASFVLKNRRYILVRPPSKPAPLVWRHVLRTGRRILQNPLGRDWPLKLVPQNVAIFKKTAEDSRGWQFHRAF